MSSIFFIGIVAYAVATLVALAVVLQRARPTRENGSLATESVASNELGELRVELQRLRDEVARMEKAEDFLRESMLATAARLRDEQDESTRRFAEVSQAIGPGGSVVRELTDWRESVSGRLVANI